MKDFVLLFFSGNARGTLSLFGRFESSVEIDTFATITFAIEFQKGGSSGKKLPADFDHQYSHKVYILKTRFYTSVASFKIKLERKSYMKNLPPLDAHISLLTTMCYCLVWCE